MENPYQKYTNIEVYFCPKCKYVLAEGENFVKQPRSYKCFYGESIHTFSKNDYCKIQRVRFSEENLNKIIIFIEYFYVEYELSIRKVAHTLMLSKSFVGKIVTLHGLEDKKIKKRIKKKMNA